MVKYAVISRGGKQYKVKVGEELLVDHLLTDKKTVEFPQVLLVVDGERVQVGTPYVAGAKVSAEVLQDERGDKIRVVKYKAKSRYRRSTGFRPSFTHLKVTEITS